MTDPRDTDERGDLPAMTDAIENALARVLDINGWGIDQAAPPAGWVEIITDAVRPEMDHLRAEASQSMRDRAARAALAITQWDAHTSPQQLAAEAIRRLPLEVDR